MPLMHDEEEQHLAHCQLAPLCSFCARTIENHRYRARTSATIAVGDRSRVWSVVPDGAPLTRPIPTTQNPTPIPTLTCGSWFLYRRPRGSLRTSARISTTRAVL